MMDLDVDNVFVISAGNGSDNGGFGHSGQGNVFNVIINNSSVATLGHEMKHGFQYLEGKIDFMYKKKEGYIHGMLYGIEDEVEANERANLLGGGYTQSQIEAEYQDKGYGCKDLNDRNDKQLERYKEKASKVEEKNNGNKNYKFNFGYEGY